jgi:hypothetical protein
VLADDVSPFLLSILDPLLLPADSLTHRPPPLAPFL